MFAQTGGKPGPQNIYQGSAREVFYSNRDHAQFVPKPSTIDGTLTSWADNTPYPFYLPAGLIMGKKTSDGKWRESIIGLTTAAVSAGVTTSVTVSAATATEFARLIALAGTGVAVNFTGPTVANANTTAANTAVTAGFVTAASGTTLTIATTAGGGTGVTMPSLISGALIQPGDGSQTILSILCDQDGLKVADGTNINRVDCFDPQILLAGGTIDTNMLINFPADTGLQAYIIAAIKAYVMSVAFYSQL